MGFAKRADSALRFLRRALRGCTDVDAQSQAPGIVVGQGVVEFGRRLDRSCSFGAKSGPIGAQTAALPAVDGITAGVDGDRHRGVGAFQLGA